MSTAYNPKIVTDGLVLCIDAANTKSYPGSGTAWSDLSGNGITGTLTNGPGFSTSNSGVLTFDGVNDYVIASNILNFSTPNQFTASIWAKSNVSTWNQPGMLIARRDGGSGQLIVHPSQGTRTVSYYTITNTGYNSISHTPDDITVFNEYCMTYNAGSLRVFFNGASANNASVGTVLTSYTGSVYIGADNISVFAGRYLNGSIASVKMYSRALSADEVLQNYNALKGRFNI